MTLCENAFAAWPAPGCYLGPSLQTGCFTQYRVFILPLLGSRYYQSLTSTPHGGSVVVDAPYRRAWCAAHFAETGTIAMNIADFRRIALSCRARKTHELTRLACRGKIFATLASQK